MKVLLLQSKPFLPVIDGGNEASRSLTRELLSAGFAVDCLTFSSEKHPFHKELFQIEPWNEIQISNVQIELKIKPIGAFRALASGKSYNLSRFTSDAWKSALVEKSKNSAFDVVLIDSLFASHEIELIKELFPKAKLLFRPHNVEFKLWMEHASNEKKALKKVYLNSIARQLKKREIEILQFFDLILPISDLDQKQIEELTKTKTALLPYFPEKNQRETSSLNEDFFFMGSMNWIPNIEAHEELCTFLFPKIKEKLRDAKLVFSGGAQNEINRRNQTGIEYVGFVENKVDFLLKSGILLAPISSGSGVRIKLIEALTLGVPVVTTVKGAEGIPFENENGLFIAENEHEFVEYAIRLSQDKKLREEISIKAGRNIEEWKSNFKLKSIFDSYV